MDISSPAEEVSQFTYGLKSNISLIFYRRKQLKLPTSDGYATIATNATAHNDATDIPIYATTSKLTVLTKRWRHP